MEHAIIGVNYVNPDWYCVEIRETNRVVPSEHGGTARHRLQIIWFYKDGRLHEYQKDLGPVENFKGINEFRVITGCAMGSRVYQEHTIGEAMDMADDMRKGSNIDVKDLLEIN